MGKIISKDIPLAEIILRKYESPGNLKDRELIRKLCLSIGLLQPGDSRDIVVDVFQVFLENKDKTMDSKEINSMVIEVRKKNNLPLKGVAPSNIRRQVKRLRDLFLVEKIQNNYRITEREQMIDLFENKIQKYYLNNIIERVREYFKAI
jgi:hypothetical protein